MRNAYVIEIETPKKYLLNGLWFGSQKPKTVIIWIHGLGSSAFSKEGIVSAIVDEETAVITFNNRGHDKVSHLIPVSKKRGQLAGESFEVFTDCVDDIQGVVDFVRGTGVKNIYLAGHSTGCQKAVYWAHKKKGKEVRGIILLAPLSDYAAARKFDSRNQLAKATKIAKKMVTAKKGKELLPSSIWPSLHSAERFLSLCTPDSVEQSIFSYFNESQSARIFKSVSLPILTLLAGKDEFADRPAAQIAEWFQKNRRSSRYVSAIIPEVGHSFHEAEAEAARHVKNFIK